MYVCNVCMYVWRKATGSFSYLAWSSSQRAPPGRGFGGGGLAVCQNPRKLFFWKSMKKLMFFNVLCTLINPSEHAKFQNHQYFVRGVAKIDVGESAQIQTSRP